jgi:hypothetical protein
MDGVCKGSVCTTASFLQGPADQHLQFRRYSSAVHHSASASFSPTTTDRQPQKDHTTNLLHGPTMSPAWLFLKKQYPSPPTTNNPTSPKGHPLEPMLAHRAETLQTWRALQYRKHSNVCQKVKAARSFYAGNNSICVTTDYRSSQPE